MSSSSLVEVFRRVLGEEGVVMLAVLWERAHMEGVGQMIGVLGREHMLEHLEER